MLVGRCSSAATLIWAKHRKKPVTTVSSTLESTVDVCDAVLSGWFSWTGILSAFDDLPINVNEH